MMNESYELGESPKITVAECLGNLTVKGDDTPSVTVRAPGDDKDISVVQEGNMLVLNSRVDCQVTCPHAATLVVQVVRGNLRIKGVHGTLTVAEVNGDASLHDGGTTTVEQVYGDLYARKILGTLAVQSVSGDARIDGVSGETTIGRAGSDLKATGLAGGLVAEAVGASARLEPPFAPGATYRVRAGSDLLVKLPEDADMRFVLQAGGGVRADVPGLELEQEDDKLTGTLGEGAAVLEAQVGGSITLSAFGSADESFEDFDFDVDLSFLDSLDELGPMIEARVAEAMAQLDVQLHEGLRFLNSERFKAHIERAAEQAERAAKRVAERARSTVAREAEHARRAAEHDAERARIRAEQAERRWQRASGHRAPSPPPSPTAPPPPAPPADDKREERMQVLRMVEEGKLSPDEAAKLLAALR